MVGLIEALRPLLALLLGVLLELFARRSQATAEDSRRQPELRDRLRRAVRRKWAGKTLPLVGLLLVLLALPGCGARTIYVSSGEPVRLRETVHSAKVWVLDADGKPTPGVMDLPEGWYCLPVPSED